MRIPYQSECGDERYKKGIVLKSAVEDKRDTLSSPIKRIPLVAAGTRPAIVLVGRPTTEWTSNAWAGRIEAFLLIKLAIQDHRRFGGVIGEGAHAPRIMTLVRINGVMQDRPRKRPRKRKRSGLVSESWGARRTALPLELLNSNLGSVPNFVNSSCVPRGRTPGPAWRTFRCSSVACRMYPFTHAVHSDVS